MAKAQTLTDAFNVAGTPDNTKWQLGFYGTNTGSTTNVAGSLNQVLNANVGSGNGPYIVSATNYDLTESYFLFRLASILPAASASNLIQFDFRCYNGGNSAGLQIVNRSTSASGLALISGGSGPDYVSSMQWLRMREHAGTIYYEYSADGIIWTTFSTAVTATMFPGGVANAVNVELDLVAGGATNLQETIVIDNFNLPPLSYQRPSYAAIGNLPAPVTTGTTMQSFVGVNGETWIAKNGVANGVWKKARDVLHGGVYRAAAYNVSNTAGVFGWDTVATDTYGFWSPNPTYAFVAPVAGFYRFTASIGMSFSAASVWYQIQLWAGPSAGLSQVTLDHSFDCGLTGGNLFTRSTALWYANVGDWLQVKHIVSSTGNGMAGLVGSVNNGFWAEYQGSG